MNTAKRGQPRVVMLDDWMIEMMTDLMKKDEMIVMNDGLTKDEMIVMKAGLVTG